MLATTIWENEGPSAATGDIAGAVERIAVSLYIDARKMGLTAPSAVQQVVEAVNGDVVNADVAPTGAGLDDDDLPFS